LFTLFEKGCLPATSKNKKTKTALAVLYVCGVLFFYAGMSSAASTIPDAATPGGAFPRTLDDSKSIPRAGDSLVIPQVIDRPLGIDEGERVMVREFILKGVQSRPEFGIREEDVAFIAEANRVKRQRLDEADMEGFTPEEVDGIAEFIRQLVEEPNQRPTSSDLWKLVFKLRHAEWNRGLTIGQMQEVADEITRYYRQHGLILATAFVPAQEVTEGKVVIEVLEGSLGSLKTESNQMYSEKMIKRPFNKFKGQVIDKDRIETGLLYLSDYPGLNAGGIFQPGSSHGESDLVIKVLEESRINGAIQADNNGSEFTGKYRARLDLSLNNPIGYADQLNVSLLQTIDPTNGTYGSVGYKIPVMRSDWSIGASAAYNIFEVVEKLNSTPKVDGESKIFRGFIRKQFQRHRSYNIYGLGELSRKLSEVDLGSSDPIDDVFDVAKLEFGFDHIDTRFAGINVGVIQLHQGLGTKLKADGFDNSTNSRRILPGGFTKATLSYSRLQTLLSNFSLLLTSQFQYTDDPLNSLEQISLGGADSVRAYPVSEYLKDVGYNVSLEWILNAPGFSNKIAFAGRRWGEVFNVSVFFDAGGGWQAGDQAGHEEVHLQGAGLALKLSLPGKFKARVQFAKVVGSTEPLNDESDSRFHFDLAYFF